MTAPKFITMKGSSHLTDKPFHVGIVQHESVMTRKRQKRLRTTGAFLFMYISNCSQPFLASKSFMKETSASTPSIGNAL